MSLSLSLSLVFAWQTAWKRAPSDIICKALRDSAEQSNDSSLRTPPASPHQYTDKRRRRLAYSCKFDLDTIPFHNRKANKWGGGDVRQLGEGNARLCVCDREAKSVKHSCNNSTQLGSAWVKRAVDAGSDVPESHALHAAYIVSYRIVSYRIVNKSIAQQCESSWGISTANIERDNQTYILYKIYIY